MKLPTFESRLDYAIQHCRFNLPKHELKVKILSDLQAFREEYRPILTPPVVQEVNLSLMLEEFDLLLMLYQHDYEWLKNSVISTRSGFNPFPGDDRPYTLAYSYLCKLFILDIFALRNLMAMRFEAQFNDLFRGIMEKSRIFPLLWYDHAFAKEYAFNDSNLSEKDRWHKFLKPNKIAKRIKTNVQTIKEKARVSGIFPTPVDQFFYEMLDFPTVKDAHSLHSQFVHSSDLKFLMTYYLETDKFDLSLRHSSSKHDFARYNYAFHYLLVAYQQVSLYHGIHGLNDTYHAKLSHGYSRVVFETRYSP